MSEEQAITASCLCGAIRIMARTPGKHLGACHCNMCRTWGGGPLLAIDCGTEVSIDGAEHVTVYDSSAWAERGFCNRCGSHLFYRLKGNQHYAIPPGLFDEDPEATFDHQVFIDEKPAYYAFANKTSDMTGAEVFAKYGDQI